MSNGIEANGPFDWLDQTIQKIEGSVAAWQRTDRLVSEVGQFLTSSEVSSDLQSVDGLKQFSQALKERNPEAGRRSQGLVDDLAACILGKEGAELALTIRMKDTDKILELVQLPETPAGRQRVARAILETPSQEFSPDLINLLLDMASEDLARVINASKVPLKFLSEILGDQQENALMELAQHLSFANFRGLDAELQKKLLDNCSPSKLYHLSIQSEKIDNLPDGMTALQFLNCNLCTNLASLPEDMTSLHSLICNRCERLASLPAALPQCTYLHINRCPLLVDTPTPEMPENAVVIRDPFRMRPLIFRE